MAASSRDLVDIIDGYVGNGYGHYSVTELGMFPIDCIEMNLLAYTFICRQSPGNNACYWCLS